MSTFQKLLSYKKKSLHLLWHKFYCDVNTNWTKIEILILLTRTQTATRTQAFILPMDTNGDADKICNIDRHTLSLYCVMNTNFDMDISVTTIHIVIWTQTFNKYRAHSSLAMSKIIYLKFFCKKKYMFKCIWHFTDRLNTK